MNMRTSVLLVVVAVAGCSPRGNHTVAIDSDQDFLVDEQGRQLIGQLAPRDSRGNYVYADLATARSETDGDVTVSLVGTTLQRTDGDLIDGVIFDSSSNWQFRVEHEIADETSCSDQPTSAKIHYRVTMREGGEEAWSDLCPDSCAVPVQGRWTDLGLYGPNSSTDQWFTFACTEAVAYKCIGYWAWPPWDDVDEYQACTRMAMFDACAENIPGTFDGTTVGMWSLDPNEPNPDKRYHGQPDYFDDWDQSQSIDPTKPYFEGGWASGGMGAICVSKYRFQTVKPDFCVGRMPDPRFDPSGQFCDEILLSSLRNRGALTVSESPIYDRGLYTWRHSSGRTLTTVRGYYASPVSDHLHPPEPGYCPVRSCCDSGWAGTCPGSPNDNWAHGFEGIVWTQIDAGPRLDQERVELQTCYDGVRNYANAAASTTTTGSGTVEPPTDYDDCRTEGYIFKNPQLFHTRPLRRYYNPAIDDYLATTKARPAGYTKGGVVLGHIVVRR
ncbi:MAG: hypothetical protein MJE77_36295 [Proteobacteria bacterium]|nr:hypothetical protein [Pseudomonadota bacterium]